MDSFVKGKTVVVTGTFPGQLRPEVERTLTDLGAIVQKSVNSRTDYLICGSKVGARKTQAAEDMEVKMLNLDDYKLIRAGAKAYGLTEEPVVIKPKLTHAEYIASIPESYGDW